MDTLWRIELLGRLRATQGDRVVDRFRARRTGSLLAYLAYHRERPHPREELIELLWPETEPQTGRTNLRRELSSLRRQLEPPGVPPGAVLVASRVSVQLNPAACATDVQALDAALQSATHARGGAERILHLTEAAEQYRGELLPGYFEDWILPERQRLAEAFFHALTQLAGYQEQVGDYHGAIQWARRAVAADPLREEGHHELIRLLHAAGQPAAALRQYHELERLLAEELGTTPAPETSALVRRDASRPVRAHSLHSPAGRSSRRSMGGGLQSPEPPSGPRGYGGERRAESLDSVSPTPAAVSPSTGTLPLSFTRFFGREREIESLRELLLAAPVRLVTLVGPGGTGKTRLALETARQMQPVLAGRVWFVSLLDLTDPRLIADKVVESLRIPHSPQVELLEQVTAFLCADPATGDGAKGPRPSLLLLDNFEHLVEGGRDLVRALLERVESLTVLVTSRRCLGLEGEQEFPVPPLPVPGRLVDPVALIHSESVRLFVDRAQAVRPDFQVTKTNAVAVAALCGALEGLPLALELAAARTGVLVPQQMLDRLQQRFELLASGRRGADPRHRSLRATLDWSYRFLTPELQRFFARLSVFRGGWTTEAAEAVCEEPRALQFLEELRQCSLVVTDTVGETMRFRLLETLREYGAEQLVAQERTDGACRHLEYYLALAESARTDAHGSERGLWLDGMEVEHDNMRAALAWSLERDVEAGLRLATVLNGFWMSRDHYREAREWLGRALERSRGAAPALRAPALDSLAQASFWLGDYSSMAAQAGEGLALAREVGDLGGIAHSLLQLGTVALGQGESERAASLLDESVTVARQSGDNGVIATALHCRGVVAYTQRDYGLAAALQEESLACYRQAGDKRMIIYPLAWLGTLALNQGQLERAKSLWEEAMVLSREAGYQRGVAGCLECLARLRKAEGQVRRAARLMAAADRLRTAISTPAEPLTVQAEYQLDVAETCAQLGEEAFAAAWAEGRVLTWQQAAAEALQEDV